MVNNYVSVERNESKVIELMACRLLHAILARFLFSYVNQYLSR